MSEEKEIFDKKFVYLEWDDALKGKKVLAGDNLQFMRRDVNDGTVKLRCVEAYSSSNINSGLYPFKDEHGTTWSIVYYDPNYSCKLAYAQGKVIQSRNPTVTDQWSDVDNPQWLGICEYRVKPENVEKQEESLEYIAVLDETETPPKVLVTLAVSSMPLDWHVLIKGPLERCKSFAVENYCKKCVHEVSICCSPYLGCQGFKKAREAAEEVKKPELQPTDEHVCGTCKYKYLPYSCTPCKECMEDDVDSGERSMWEPIEVKKRRKTNRELAKWVAQGNGQVRHRDCDYVHSIYNAYNVCDDDKPCPDYLVIRGWDETEWHEPEVEE